MKIFVDQVCMPKAVTMAEDFLINKAFLEVTKRSHFSFTELTTSQISERLKRLPQEIKEGMHSKIEVVSWWPWNRWTSATAYTTWKEPNKIFVNMRMLKSRTDLDWAQTLVHEFVHVYFPDAGHGNNRNQHTEPKLSSLPVWLAAQVKE